MSNSAALLQVPSPTLLRKRPATPPSPKVAPVSFDLLAEADALRLQATALLPQSRRSEMGQFLTPAPVARLLASLLQCDAPAIAILDAGAGVGSLFAAAVVMLCQRAQRPTAIHVTAYEIDLHFAPFLQRTLALCRRQCEALGIAFTSTVHLDNFLSASVDLLDTDMLSMGANQSEEPRLFNCVIQNPPYRKINTNSIERTCLRRIGIETTNLYTGFLFASMRLLAPGGELVAITPRSFCNGPYFLPFRQAFLSQMKLSHMHIFETRQEAFKEDAVLQETLVFRAIKATAEPATVTVAASITAENELSRREVPYHEVVNPADPECFIHVAPNHEATDIRDQIAKMTAALPDLGLQVSTGRVVTFRATEFLRDDPGSDTAPLIWPLHMEEGYVAWPRQGTKKPNAIASNSQTASLLVPNGNYVLVKRFSAKEQRRRITAAVHEAARLTGVEVGIGFENHLNYFHAQGEGISLELARGLAAYLNSTLVDAYFRLYSGHTQVNATDLRNIPYPNRPQLLALGKRIGKVFPAQKKLDTIIQEELFTDGQ